MALWKKIVLGILGGFGAIITISVVLAFWLTADVVAKVEAHLDALKSGDLRGAYEQTATQFQSNTSLEQYEAFIQRYPSLSHIGDYDIGGRSVENGIGTVEVTVEGTDGSSLPVTFSLLSENDDWFVYGIEVGGAPDVVNE